MEEVISKLAEYTLSLKETLESTHEANERPLLVQRLAAAAEIFALLHLQNNVSAVENIVKTEIRAHGWSYISGSAGEDIGQKWVAFTNAAGIHT
jgi:ABC-type amino acid transport system permease subunit